MSHPNVLYPLVKEIRSADPLAWRPYYPTAGAVRRHARRHGIALCPFVAPYLHFLDIPIALSRVRPETKIIITLRNPVDLVFSEWKWVVLHTASHVIGRTHFINTYANYVQNALELFPAGPEPFGLALHNGLYASAVTHWLSAFGERNVRIFDVADYFRDRNVFLTQLEQFLGLPHAPLPPALPVANRNPLKGLSADLATTAKLKEFFEPYNRTLWDVIGTKYSW